MRLSLYVNGKTLIKSEGQKDTADKKASTQKLKTHDFQGQTFEFGDQFKLHPKTSPVSLFAEVVEKKVTFGSLYSNTKTVGMVEIKLQDIEQTAIPSKVPKSYQLEPSKNKTAFGKSPGKGIRHSDELGQIKLLINWKAGIADGSGSSSDVTPFKLEELGHKKADEDDPEYDESGPPEFDPNVLIVRVICADELRVMDKSWSGGSSDPRVRIRLDGANASCWKRPNMKDIDGIATKGQKACTKTIKQTLQPIWNETFMIPCSVGRLPIRWTTNLVTVFLHAFFKFV